MNDARQEKLPKRHVPRGLDRRVGMRRLSAVLWPAFVGAVAMTVALYFVPESWKLPPETPTAAAVTFGVCWLLALIPAAFANALAGPFTGRIDDAR
ncbi:MAG: hypothetical protein IRZ06_01945 [Nevskia sp.]|nr:hypothetical protein [Nevskia sp.]